MLEKLTRLMPIWTKETRHNKAYALVLISLGLLVVLLGGDGTALVFCLVIGLPLICAKETWID